MSATSGADRSKVRPDAGMARVGVLLSGRGSNFVALAQALAREEAPAEIVLVVSNVAEAPGLVRASELEIPALALPHRQFASRAAQEVALEAALRAAGVEWICLAGYMRLLSPQFVAGWPQRILNVHPSLLPAFPGLYPQRQALAAGVRVSGCTVHLVDAGLDSGPIVEQRAVAVSDGDDETALAARILVEEHRAYPRALRRLLTERWSVADGRLSFAVDARTGEGAK
ncbi:MAG: phosphoribosylglycinamide formyltransferase [Bryobacteraceae bacterium]